MPRYSDPQRQKLYIQRLSESHKGKLVGDKNPSRKLDVRKRISDKLKGRDCYWLKGENNQAKRPEVREKIKNNLNSKKTRFKKGQAPWNKGLTKETSELVNAYVKKKIGVKRTEEQRQRMKAGLPSDHGERARETIFKCIAEGKWRKAFNTKPEREMKKILLELGLIEKKDFISQKRIGNYMFDFFLIYMNLVIECDGEYWHNLPEVKTKDRIKEEYLKERKYPLLRFWDYEIYNRREEVRNKIFQFINH